MGLSVVGLSQLNNVRVGLKINDFVISEAVADASRFSSILFQITSSANLSYIQLCFHKIEKFI